MPIDSPSDFTRTSLSAVTTVQAKSVPGGVIGSAGFRRRADGQGLQEKVILESLTPFMEDLGAVLNDRFIFRRLPRSIRAKSAPPGTREGPSKSRMSSTLTISCPDIIHRAPKVIGPSLKASWIDSPESRRFGHSPDPQHEGCHSHRNLLRNGDVQNLFETPLHDARQPLQNLLFTPDQFL